MNNICKYTLKLILLFVLSLSFTVVSYAKPDIYLFIGSGPAQKYASYLQDPNIKGAQIIYSWKTLEPEENFYNFKAIEKDLRFLKTLNKSLFIQIQDKSFNPKIINVPHYLLSKKYEGGVAEQTDFQGEGKPLSEGWVAKQWLPAVQQRFQKLLSKLGTRFDGEIAGINLSETAIDLDKNHLPPYYSCNLYFNSVINNLKALRLVFHKSYVLQYINFFPCEWNNDHHYMSRLFAFAAKNKIGLGGPDVVPYRRGQMKNSYPFFHRYKGKLQLIAFAIQSPDYTYRNPKTGTHFTVAELYDFAKNYLGADIIFWNTKQPQYSNEVLSFLNTIKQSK